MLTMTNTATNSIVSLQAVPAEPPDTPEAQRYERGYKCTYVETWLSAAIERCSVALRLGFFCPHAGEVQFSVGPDHLRTVYGLSKMGNTSRGWRYISVPMDTIRAAYGVGRDEAVQRVVKIAVTMAMRDVG